MLGSFEIGAAGSGQGRRTESADSASRCYVLNPPTFTHLEKVLFHIAFLLVVRAYHRDAGHCLVSHCFCEYNHTDGRDLAYEQHAAAAAAAE